jgi:hypothetical protein
MAGKTPPAAFQNRALEEWSSPILPLLDLDCATQNIDTQVFSVAGMKTCHTTLYKMYSLPVLLLLCVLASLHYLLNQSAALPSEVSGTAIPIQSVMGGRGWQWIDVRFRCSPKTALQAIVSNRLNITQRLKLTNQNVNFKNCNLIYPF